MSSSSNTSMRAFGVTEYKAIGDLTHLKEYQVPMPQDPKGHDILVDVKAVATNPIDYKRLANLGDTKADFGQEGPLIVGWDASGVVKSVGPDVTLFQPGDEVMFAGDFFRPGSFAEYTLVDERIVGKKPSNLSWADAATIPLTWLTAYESLVDRLHIDPNHRDTTNKGKTILITAGAGGVGSAAIAVAKNVLGLTVIATASREESTSYVKERGADFVVSHREAYKPQLEKIGLKDGINYVLHASDLTPELFTEFVDIVKPFGGIASIWPAATVDVMQLFWKSINFAVELMFTRPTTNDDTEMKRQNEILTIAKELMEAGAITPTKTQEFPLTAENLKKALEIQASGKAVGKLALSFE